MLGTLAVWVPMFCYFIGFFPGLMTDDSFVHWDQVVGGGWRDLQPPAYTALLWVAERVAGSPWPLALAQSLLLAAAVVAVARALIRLGVPPKVMIGVTAVIAVTPMLGAFSIVIWKDIPYTALLLLASARLIDVARARFTGDQGSQRSGLLRMAGWLAAATLFRQNGFVLAIALLAILLIVLVGVRKTVLTGLAIVVLVLGVVKFAFYPLVGIEGANTYEKLSTIVIHDIGAMTNRAPEAFTPKDRRLLATVAPLRTWKREFNTYGCYNANWQYEFDFRAVFGNGDKWWGLWFDLVASHPFDILDNRLCSGSSAWNPELGGPQYSVPVKSIKHPSGIDTSPVIDLFNEVGTKLLFRVNDVDQFPYTWRAPFWIYVADAGLIFVAIRRRQARWLLLALPMLAQQASVAFWGPVQDARYMIASLFYAWLVLPVVVLGFKGDADATAGTDPATPATPATPVTER